MVDEQEKGRQNVGYMLLNKSPPEVKFMKDHMLECIKCTKLFLHWRQKLKRAESNHFEKNTNI